LLTAVEDESIDVELTRTAERQLTALRGRRAQAARRALEALIAHGCKQAASSSLAVGGRTWSAQL
jgi:hypothetical protein